MNQLDQDIIFLDPPWGGTDYKKKKNLLCLVMINLAVKKCLQESLPSIRKVLK